MNEEMQQTKEKGEVLLSWKFPGYPRYERGLGWYFFIGLVFALLLGYAFLTKNFLFAVIIILFAAISFLIERHPRELECKITPDGAFIGEKFYSYSDMDTFWIVYDPPDAKNLYFHTKSILIPRIIIALEDQNPLEVKKILSRYMREDIEQEKEPLLDSWTRFLKL